MYVCTINIKCMKLIGHSKKLVGCIDGEKAKYVLSTTAEFWYTPIKNHKIV